MKTIIQYAALIILLAGVPAVLKAEKFKGDGAHKETKKSSKSISAGCAQGATSTELDINNVRALIHTGGDMWWDFEDAYYYIPAESKKTALFAGSIWIGGEDINGQLKLSALRFRSNGVDYWPGPLKSTGADQSNVTAEVCEEFDKHFVITRQEVSLFRAWYNMTPDERAASEQFKDYKIPESILEWPAHGDDIIYQITNDSSAYDYDHYLAPFWDNPNEGVQGEYNPESDGDYPFFDLDGDEPCGTTRENRKERLYGDKTMWWVYNDKGNVHGETRGSPVGMEIRAQAFGFSTNDELNNMTFYNYALDNRSTFTLRNTYFGVWTDADMGYAFDDYVGCDVTRGLGYLYNGKDIDGTGQIYAYGGPEPPPPAIGVDFFEGPYQDADSSDNPTNWDASRTLQCTQFFGYRKRCAIDTNKNPNDTICDPTQWDSDTSKYKFEWLPVKEEDGGVFKEVTALENASMKNGNINGLNFGDGIVDNERWGMRRYIYHNNDNTAMGDPQQAIEYYQYLKGIWRYGNKLLYGGTGHPSGATTTTTEADFMFPGDTDPCNWGTNGVDMGGDPWTEENENNPPFDRRFIQSAGPFTLEPGAVNDITTGVVWARASSGNPWESVKKVNFADDKAQRLFENCFQILEGPDAPELTIIEMDKELIVHISNREGSNNYNEVPEDYEKKDLFIVCPDTNNNGIADDICDQTYNFQGYQVFQLKDKETSVDEIHDPEKARLVFQCDIKDGVTNLVNFEWSDEMQANVPTLEVEGTDEGIRHTFRIEEDKFATGDKDLVNNREYYYIALAYAYNEYMEYDQNDPLAIEGQKKPYLASRKSGTGGPIAIYSAIPHLNSPENEGTVVNSEYGDQPAITRLEGLGNGMLELELSQKTIDEILSGPPWKADSVTYKKNCGPVNVKVIDPLNVPAGYFELRFDTNYINKTNPTNGAIGLTVTGGEYDQSTKWSLYRPSTGEVYNSEKFISIDNSYEYIIGEIGLSVSIKQCYFQGEDKNKNNSILSSSFTFADNNKKWLDFIDDVDGESPRNWIRCGKKDVANSDGSFTSVETWDDWLVPTNPDPNEEWEKIVDGKFAPYRVVSWDRINVDNEPRNLYGFGKMNVQGLINWYRYERISSIDLVITADTSKWTRSPVIEMTPVDTLEDGSINPKQPTEGNVRKFSLRAGASKDKQGRTGTNQATANGTQPTGMSYFPGYAIDVETGERLNIMFGEASWFIGENGRDMLWNPTSDWRDNLFRPVWGAFHVIYIVGHHPYDTQQGSFPYYMTHYDEGKQIYDYFQANDDDLVWQKVDWVAIPILNSSFDNYDKQNNPYGFLACDATIKIRIGSPYRVAACPDFEKDNPRNANWPMFSFSTNDLAAVKADNETAKNALDEIRVVPNPYYGFSEYEINQLDNIVKITNLPKTCKVRIYNIKGSLIRTFDKDSPQTYIEWDLKNQYNIPIAGGVYIIYIEAPGIGEKVVKWFGALRPVDLNSF